MLYEAEQLLTQSCMRARGFRIWVVPRTPLPEDRDFPYVVDDTRWAREHGYGSDMQRRRDQVRASDPNRRYFQSLSPADRMRGMDALHGKRDGGRLEVTVPNGMNFTRYTEGCTARAQEQLYGDLEGWFRSSTITNVLDDMGRGKVFAEQEFKDAVKDWAACMRKRGFRHATPEETRRAFSEPSDAAARTKEIRTAVAEADCARSSGLSDTALRLEKRQRDRLAEQYAPEYETRKRLERVALPRARAIVERG
ncbi:hypothetical protein [Nonomuraea aridisoli]|uniref:Uncharacterized protein n=1 Tax=Nonomuraea aridisoli TaxID=2070368 RepID=A0A2W2E708_9ACTN|nr:hypothetical protein [Nonomuraea aridisoli]PZG20086.1 hypothetical protein C1J01_10430 [Nonomuraea aridisoli]